MIDRLHLVVVRLKVKVRRLIKLFFRVGVHLFIIAAGVWGLFWPPATVQGATSWVILILWSALFIVGGSLCILGLRRTAYGPQVLGLVLTSGGILTYAVALSGSWPNSGVAVLLFCAFADQQISRLVQLRQLARAGVDGGRGFWRSPVAANAVHGDSHPHSSGGGLVRGTEG